MSPKQSQHDGLWAALKTETPLQVVGVINAYSALLAQQAGLSAIYLSGSGVAAASYGLPDLALTTLANVLEDVRRISQVTDLPLLVDADTGWGNEQDVAQTTRQLIAAGAAGMHMEDQVEQKRCGHRPGKMLVSADQMADRVKAAVDARTQAGFVVMARTDAADGEGVDAAVERASRYVEVGADMIFAEALTELEQYRAFTQALDVPVLANLTEFGRTPLFTLDDLRKVGVALALYPLSGFRAMSAAALHVYETIHQKGTQQETVSIMQTRQQLYRVLNYEAYEQQVDQQLKEQADE